MLDAKTKRCLCKRCREDSRINTICQEKSVERKELMMMLMLLIWMIGFGIAVGVLHAMVKDGVLDMGAKEVIASMLVLLVLWPHFIGYVLVRNQ